MLSIKEYIFWLISVFSKNFLLIIVLHCTFAEYTRLPNPKQIHSVSLENPFLFWVHEDLAIFDFVELYQPLYYLYLLLLK